MWAHVVGPALMTCRPLRSFVPVACGTLLVVLLAGCGSGDDTATSSTGTATDTETDTYEGPRSKGASDSFAFMPPSFPA